MYEENFMDISNVNCLSSNRTPPGSASISSTAARPFGTLSKQRGERRNWTYEEQEQTKKEEEILSDQYREFINMGQ